MRNFIVPVVLALVTTPAMAADRTGFGAIAAGDLRSAESVLTAERRIYPERPELMLNLAAVYGKTGRQDAARSLYAEVLDRPAVSMLMASGATVSSHAIARRGLDLTAPAVLATR